MANTNGNLNSIVLLFLISSSVLVCLPSPAASICVPRKSTIDDHGAPSQSSPSPAHAPDDSDPSNVPLLTNSLSDSSSADGGSFFSGKLGILDRLCSSTDYKQLCTSTLAPVIHGKATSGGPPTAKSILQAAINVAVAETKLAMTVIDGLIKEVTNENARSALGDCTDSYNDALDNFQAAMDAIGKWDLGTINSMLSASIASFSDCNDELSGIVTKFAVHGKRLMQMTSNCLAIASVAR
ncbi:hypothetical protein MLD38_036016 [Melastoma candidum]|uniref:Uncharacterized protein n=1 Tax=Melastoma candidum TaxID=119954 RepID=A0ACB9LK80_9MYRT|nr:hypothetical protein MLD38_036016 [Melastoma candidum]